MREQMTSRERMMAAMTHQPMDRVPLDIWAVGEVWDKLRAHFGEGVDIGQALGIDGFSGSSLNYVGPKPADLGPDEFEDMWGLRFRKQHYNGGEYWEIYHNPLAAAQTIDDLEAYRWPRLDWWDFTDVREQAKQAHAAKPLMLGYMAPLTYHLYLRGQENCMTDPLLDAEFTRHFLNRLCEYNYELHRRHLEAVAPYVDLVQVTDDLGMQTGPILSVATWREFYKPWTEKFCKLGHEFGCKVFHHDDGAIREFLPDLIAIGVNVLNPIQWPCPGMDQAGLKRDFGDALCFHGAMDNQRTMPFGTVEEVRAEVRYNIDVLASDKTGFILAPCHNMQANTPVENILAMYDEARTYGVFS